MIKIWLIETEYVVETVETDHNLSAVSAETVDEALFKLRASGNKETVVSVKRSLVDSIIG